MYKTILLHCNDKRRLQTLLAPALHLAEASQAHLTALSVVPPIEVISAGVESPPIVVDTHRELYRAENPAMRATFEDAVRTRGITYEWRDDDAGAFGVADRVLDYARAADIVVASQADTQWPGSDRLDVVDRLAIESGRPVLIIPNSGRYERVGQKVLVAWNGRRESARAVFDAVPILQRAKEVRVVWVNPQSERDVAGDLPTADICTALARHHVKAQATEQVQPRTSVGETLLGCADEFGADLLVMGCYGHTRLREFVFGGASRHILNHMSVPVLMSH